MSAANSGTATVAPITEAIRFADQLERSFRGGAWQGPSLTEALEGVSPTAAYRRPVAGAHSIAELVFHVDFWLEASRRRMAGEAEEGSSSEPDWPSGVDGKSASAPAWEAALAHLQATHRRLHAAVLALDDERFDQPVPGSDPTLRGLLLGILQHNAYHTGQITLLARAAAKAGPGAAPSSSAS
ncbi:MAG: DinB family protein [Thermoanaerobaculia bacterium]